MTTKPINLYVSETEDQPLEIANKYIPISLSKFRHRKALKCVEVEIMNRTVVEIPDQRWQAFEAWLHTPAQTIPALQHLAVKKPVWE